MRLLRKNSVYSLGFLEYSLISKRKLFHVTNVMGICFRVEGVSYISLTLWRILSNVVITSIIFGDSRRFFRIIWIMRYCQAAIRRNISNANGSWLDTPTVMIEITILLLFTGHHWGNSRLVSVMYRCRNSISAWNCRVTGAS